MRRRDLLKGASASFAVLATPRMGRAERTNKLVFVPTEDLSVLDPHLAGPAGFHAAISVGVRDHCLRTFLTRTTTG
jgi:hypothetical protein